ncbi:LEAF RUST 10 DISEASE-RESISTANCE LOCUS RECEPTOR-LIKE PROTEIN KINASE-like 2.5 isoform X1 [Quercus robur]|uniref:LEAF RUST 10 DISEASE-RESISTANCE LOCUS RECEPTOR-LIKE PROTEIN KINASE-like 2.5 isoform X1 n=1 Tax=Quercus robur TaxID=38942 RepID=UPI0021614574|nr:LEAF RUST 10 DISEASE-RESISTANCE LOCUS RECEPTOR-LIKE PROTEIN KINASE-like 2.5 isoform X1 [Quercus robur]
MHPHLFPTITLFLIIVTITLIHCPTSLRADNKKYLACEAPFNCSNLVNLSYPFWASNRPNYCGHPSFQLNCSSDVPQINLTTMNYSVLEIITSSRTLKVARTDYLDPICPAAFVNTTIDNNLFSYITSSDTNLTLYYNCRTPLANIPTLPSYYQFNCSRSSSTEFINYYTLSSETFLVISNAIGACNYWVNVPILLSKVPTTATYDAVIAAIESGFMLEWDADNSQCDTCLEAGGLCGSDPTTSTFACHCTNGTFASGCSSESTRSSSKLKRKIVIGITAAVLGTIVVFIIICCLRREQLSKALIFRRTARKNDENVKAFILNYGSLAPKHYSYAEIKKMTNSFINKLGQGGYSSVYKGKLPDGKLVAVKVLSESKGNGEDFINEVASICRTSHVNIVTLLGFSYEKNKRALIYEFMPNGSLDKFIYHRESSATNCRLEWKTLYKIAVDIARGLEYLHRGCSTRILHFDIKPQNILLDEDFNPKISDFGLAKLCQRKDSIVSMNGMRGTAGYIAPEVFSRSFGGVSHKSDVYSYGMLILEMVGGRKNFDAGVSNSSEKYFPDWIYKDLELDLDGRTRGVITEEKETSSKMILVSLWCIQTNPTDRPSMNKVVEMLEGTLHSLQIPPKPFLCSPKVSPMESSTTS